MQAWYKHIQNMVQAHTEKDTCSSNTMQPCVGLLTASSTKNVSVTICSLIKGKERNHYVEAHTCFIRVLLYICFYQSALKASLCSVSVLPAPSAPLTFSFMWCKCTLTRAEKLRKWKLLLIFSHVNTDLHPADIWHVTQCEHAYISLSGKQLIWAYMIISW